MPAQSMRLKTVTVFFVIALVFLVTSGLTVASSLLDFSTRQGWVEHTYQVGEKVDQFWAAVQSVENGQRGYFIKPNQFSLQRRGEGLKNVWTRLEELRTLTSDNAVQQAKLAQLTTLTQNRIELLEKTMNTFEKTRDINSITDTFTEGQTLIDQMIRLLDSMRSEERTLLQRRVKAADEQRTYVFLIFGLSKFINLFMLIAFYGSFRKHMRTQAEEAVKTTKEVWLKTASNESSALVAGDQPIRSMTDSIVKYIHEKTEAVAVNFYVEEDGHFRCAAGSACDPTLIHRIGQGLVGRAASLMVPTIIDEVPEDFFKVTSSLGETLPKFLIYAPIRFRDELMGVIEIARFKKPSDDDLNWLSHVIDAAAAGLATARTRMRLQDLLEETQRQSEELQQQQEELRTTNEELDEQAKALLDSQHSLQVQAEELRQTNEELEQQTRALEAQQDTLNVKNQALETSRKHLEEKAQELERASAYKSEFLAKMSHELRTPLNSLMILATILRENKEDNLSEQQVDYARTIYEAGIDLLDLINDILDLSKLEARKLTARPEAFSIKGFLDQVASSFEPQVSAKGIGFNIMIDSDVSDRVVTDRQRLQQIIRNLLSNALKFTEKGEVSLRVSKLENKPGFLALGVSDTGIGIADAKKKLIWEAFEQADGSVSRKYGGTGLGLTISRELAGLLGGQIEVQSEEGKGSTFTLQIPEDLRTIGTKEPEFIRSSETTTSEPPPLPPEFHNEQPAKHTEQELQPIRDEVKNLPEGAKTILIVEDDSQFRAAVADAAKSHGFTPIEASDGSIALEILSVHTPQAILLDIKLPDLSGMTILDRLKRMPNVRHVPVHMISALDYQHNALRLGAIGYLGKPVTIDGVRAALSRIENVIDKAVKRLLVVEDDDRQRKAIIDLVSAEGTEVVAVDSGKQAIERLSKGDIDCMILDLKLPDTSGFELLQEIETAPFMSMPPVIVYTGKDLSPQEEDRLRKYSDSIIIKGAKSPERLLDEVNLFLHRVESDLPAEKRTMLQALRTQDANFNGKNILLVDDDVRNLFALTSALEAKGFAVTVARNGLEAIEKLDSHAEVDLVLMDIMMPKMDGFEAMKRIREKPEFKKLPIIALTAKAMKGEHDRCIAAGANDYLPKPINLGDLLSVLKVWLPNQGLIK